VTVVAGFAVVAIVRTGDPDGAWHRASVLPLAQLLLVVVEVTVLARLLFRYRGCSPSPRT